VLSVAVAAHADVIISGDADLLTLGSQAEIPIIDAAEAVASIDSDRLGRHSSSRK
jgi:predicted nucleic acid-binding protein